jgi:hypothetical protein
VQTTIEFYMNWEETYAALRKGKLFRNQFDKGWRKNLCRVLGDQYQYPWYISILPIWVTLPPPDYPFDLGDLLDGTSDLDEARSFIV